ncbi:hypothetical protein AB0K48_58095 [Nonomuraea sp. NPDC055795]
MTSFAYVAEDLKVSRTTFEGGLEIIASHDRAPRTIGPSVAVAPHGFVALSGGTPLYALTADPHHEPGYLSRWDGERFVPEIAWYPADLAGYRSNVIRSDLKLTVTGTSLAVTEWDGTAVDLTGAEVRWEVSDRRIAKVRDGRLVLCGGKGWATVRAVVTRAGVPAYTSVERVTV